MKLKIHIKHWKMELETLKNGFGNWHCNMEMETLENSIKN